MNTTQDTTLEEKMRTIKKQLETYAQHNETGKAMNLINNLPNVYTYKRHELVLHYYDSKRQHN